MAYNPSRRRIVLADTGSTSLGTYEYDGTTWRSIATAPSIGALSNGTLAYDPVQQRMLRFGTRTFGLGRPATTASSGAPCGSSTRGPWLHADLAVLGERSWSHLVYGGRPGAPCALGLSMVSSATPAVPCTIRIGNPAVWLVATTDALGVARFSGLPIPNQTSAYRHTVFAQGAVLDPAGSLGGLSLTQGVASRVGD